MTDNIVFSSDPAEDLTRFLRERSFSKMAVLVDEHTRQHCYPLLQAALPAHELIVIPPGEEQKNISTCVRIWEKMTAAALDRHSALIIIGGGVLGDMGGFCAATYKRGIDFILIPTTLLSQVDASIGGKLGIDFQHFKNHIGVFQTPVLTLLHSGFLRTLPDAEKRSGFAEVIKHALIADAAGWHDIRVRTFEQQPWERLLPQSVSIKSKVVKEDPYEKGLRKTLNAGHTIGHAVETYLLQHNRKILHGEAVAVGLISEGYLARQKGMLSEEDFLDMAGYIKNVFPKAVWSEKEEEAIAELTAQDKKNKENRILCVLLDGIGKAKWDCEITRQDVKTALAFYRAAYP